MDIGEVEGRVGISLGVERRAENASDKNDSSCTIHHHPPDTDTNGKTHAGSIR
jgi:hypothetical protein